MHPKNSSHNNESNSKYKNHSKLLPMKSMFALLYHNFFTFKLPPMIETFIFVNSRDVLCFTSSDEILSWQRLSPVFFTFERGVQAHKKAEISSRPGLPDLVGLGQLCYIYINTKIEKILLFFLHDQLHTVNPFNHNNRIFFNRIQI